MLFSNNSLKHKNKLRRLCWWWWRNNLQMLARLCYLMFVLSLAANTKRTKLRASVVFVNKRETLERCYGNSLSIITNVEVTPVMYTCNNHLYFNHIHYMHLSNAFIQSVLCDPWESNPWPSECYHNVRRTYLNETGNNQQTSKTNNSGKSHCVCICTERLLEVIKWGKAKNIFKV